LCYAVSCIEAYIVQFPDRCLPGNSRITKDTNKISTLQHNTNFYFHNPYCVGGLFRVIFEVFEEHKRNTQKTNSTNNSHQHNNKQHGLWKYDVVLFCSLELCFW
jgi:hypothetical protein